MRRRYIGCGALHGQDARAGGCHALPRTGRRPGRCWRCGRRRRARGGRRTTSSCGPTRERPRRSRRAQSAGRRRSPAPGWRARRKTRCRSRTITCQRQDRTPGRCSRRRRSSAASRASDIATRQYFRSRLLRHREGRILAQMKNAMHAKHADGDNLNEPSGTRSASRLSCTMRLGSAYTTRNQTRGP